MIGRITGTLLEKNPPTLIVDVQGLGYEVDVPMSTFYTLPACGERVLLHTHFVVREDAQLLFGFATVAERLAFRQLLKISGIGARTALSVLSGLSVAELNRAVTLQEAGRLTKIPGIGKKTAERLLLELRDRLPKLGLSPQISAGETAINGDATALEAPDALSDILNALLALGYNEREALSSMKALPADVAVSDGIRQALKLLSKA
jgi:holliday junction DNA helicase RuvA